MRTKYKYKVNWEVVGAALLNIVLWAIVILLLWVALGCSTMKQSAEFTDKNGASVKLVNSKTSWMYWSKYQADVNNYGMSTNIYNAEEHPDANSVKAFAEGVTDTILKVVKP